MNSNLYHTGSLTFRLYASEEDLLRMLGLLMVACACTNDWRSAHVGELLLISFMVACHLNLHKR